MVRFKLRTLLAVVAVVGLVFWGFSMRPSLQEELREDLKLQGTVVEVLDSDPTRALLLTRSDNEGDYPFRLIIAHRNADTSDWYEPIVVGSHPEFSESIDATRFSRPFAERPSKEEISVFRKEFGF